MYLAPDSITADIDKTSKEVTKQAHQASKLMGEMSEECYDVELLNYKTDDEYLKKMRGYQQRVKDVAATHVSLYA